MINDDTVLTVISVRGQQVRLQFDAPKDVSVDREEIRAKKLKESDEEGHY